MDLVAPDDLGPFEELLAAASVKPDKRVSTHTALRVSDWRGPVEAGGRGDESRVPSLGW